MTTGFSAPSFGMLFLSSRAMRSIDPGPRATRRNAQAIPPVSSARNMHLRKRPHPAEFAGNIQLAANV